MTKHNILRKQYILNEQNYQLKIPMELDALIPENDSVRLISQFVEEMDLTALYDTYERMPSEKYASPEIMLKVMLYHTMKPKIFLPGPSRKNAGVISITNIFWKEELHLIMPRSQDSEQSTLQNVRKASWPR